MMMTMQKVLDVFREYLEQDVQVEIILTRHGYTFLLWDSKQETWIESQICKTPEDLMDILLDNYACYEEYLFTRGTRDLTGDEKCRIVQKGRALQERCEQD